ncbi:MAG: hypothetical protein KA297_18335 [Kofleriaceae bacterium]|jgi:hypothetical protein|nr:hypothetical protein [Kofleriaceae bacterium]MBP6836159.1 hypothetical protein [Kofleriaceae bacterium]MBP8812130.1 hypothetical protein [Kofleriaceae bacterium]
MRRDAALVLLVLGLGLTACRSNPGAPRYPTARPPALAANGPARAPAEVAIGVLALPWWTLAGSRDSFILERPASEVHAGARLGPIRTADHLVDGAEVDDLRCAWMIVPMGDPRPCLGRTRADARAHTTGVLAALDEALRGEAGAIGAAAVADVRCFVHAGSALARAWCEGVALAPLAAGAPAAPGSAAIRTTAVPVTSLGDGEVSNPPSRLVVLADTSVGAHGRRLTSGFSFGLRYRPVEATIGLVLFDDDAGQQAGMGGGLLGRYPLGASRADVVVGVSAHAVATNGATNPDFASLYQGFIGLAYQSPWRWGGRAQPWAQLRLGAATGGAIDDPFVPAIDLHLGLSSPERR